MILGRIYFQVMFFDKLSEKLYNSITSAGLSLSEALMH